MIVYKCDLCGAVVPANDLVTIHAASFDVSKCFEICPDCYKEIADKAKATREQNTEQRDATKEEKNCKACKYSDKGMINVESERCKACYYDGRLGGNCLFVPKQTATKEGAQE